MASTPHHLQLERRAIDRCLDELARAILFRRALRGLHRAETYHGIDFVRLSSLALYDQMFSHAVKVLNPREKAGFWYLVRQHPAESARICAQHAILLGYVRSITKGLLLIRNKTLFHLDAKGVVAPSKIWKEAGITVRQLDDGLDASFRLLCKLRKRIKGEEYELPDYDGEDATRILMLADHADLFNHPLEHGVAVSYVTEYGFWLRTPEGDRFLAFANFPRFRDAPVRHILHVEEVTPGHYHWPDLDVDLSLQIIRNPERFPLVSKQT